MRVRSAVTGTVVRAARHEGVRSRAVDAAIATSGLAALSGAAASVGVEIPAPPEALIITTLAVASSQKGPGGLLAAILAFVGLDQAKGGESNPLRALGFGVGAWCAARGTVSVVRRMALA